MTGHDTLFRFTVGSRVRLLANPNHVGTVQQSRQAQDEPEYEIFFGARQQAWYNESDLEASDSQRAIQPVGRRAFLRNLGLAKINGGFSDLLYSYTASKTEIEAYQFRPAAKFLENGSHRLLIADEVGLGKTIEAGIIFLELKARMRLTRFLVVCPSRLRRKWQSEFRDRFAETLEDINRLRFQRFLDDFKKYGTSTPFSGVIAIETLRDATLSEQIAELGVTFDLVVIDEAHHFRNTSTMTHRSGQALSDATDAMLLLTATPVNLGNVDLYNLLHILDEGAIPDHYTFEQFLAPATVLNESMSLLGQSTQQQQDTLSRLRGIVHSPVGVAISRNPEYKNIIGLLSEKRELTRAELIDTKHRLAALSPLSSIINRTKKRDVGAGALRDAHMLSVELTENERTLYDLVLRYTRLEHSYSNRGTPPGFALVMKERQAASCLPAIRESFIAGLDDEYEGIETDLEDEHPVAALGNIQLENIRREMRALAREIGDEDSKFTAFLEGLREVYNDNTSAKVLVFSTFKGTLKYLQRRLLQQSWVSGQVHLITGDVPVIDRSRHIENFQNGQGFAVMLLSEVGAEGLDFQFTDVLFNYDLPWNPMRVEQRIGRIDRYGQQSKSVRIYSFFLSETIDQRILQRLYERVGVFHQSIGELEPILGEIEREVTRSIFTSTLTEEQQYEIANRMLDALEQKKIDQQAFDSLENQLMGQDMLLAHDDNGRLSKGRYLSGEELRAILEDGLRFYGAPHLDDKTGGYYFLRSTARFREDLMRFCESNQITGSVVQEVFAALNERGIPITFEGNLAHMRPLVHLLNFRHPIIRFAASRIPEDQTGPSDLGILALHNEDWPSGYFPFFIYQLDIQSIDARSELAAVVLDDHLDIQEELSERLLADILASLDVGERPAYMNTMISDYWSMYSEYAQEEFASIRRGMTQDIQSSNDVRLDIRRSALARTYAVKIARIQEWSMSNNERIRRMRQSQLENTKAERDRKLDELEEFQRVSVGGRLLLQGIIVANRPPPHTSSQYANAFPTVEA